MSNDLAAQTTPRTRDVRPLIAHVVYRFDTGGLENGVVNLINHLPADRFRHAVVALTEVTEFARRVRRPDVEFIGLRKPPGQGFKLIPRMTAVLRELGATVVHTRNLAALEMQLAAWLAGVPVRIHGEHGRDVEDLHGRSPRHRWIRRVYRPLVQHQVALSRDLAEYLRDSIGVPAHRISHICNGVDSERFQPPAGARSLAPGMPFDPAQHFVVGTVGRMQAVKDQSLLAHAFVAALAAEPSLRATLRLVLVGEGPLRAECRRILAAAGADHLAWLPGERSDVPELLRSLSLFVLPSLAEGISNTILESMATGLPVVATSVGGNAELVDHGRSGAIVPAGEVGPMAEWILAFAREPERARAMGAEGRVAVEHKFSLAGMVASYQALYEQQMQRAGVRCAAA